jgi:hypothetical protein
MGCFVQGLPQRAAPRAGRASRAHRRLLIELRRAISVADSPDMRVLPEYDESDIQQPFVVKISVIPSNPATS